MACFEWKGMEEVTLYSSGPGPSEDWVCLFSVLEPSYYGKRSSLSSSKERLWRRLWRRHHVEGRATWKKPRIQTYAWAQLIPREERGPVSPRGAASSEPSLIRCQTCDWGYLGPSSPSWLPQSAPCGPKKSRPHQDVPEFLTYRFMRNKMVNLVSH